VSAAPDCGGYPGDAFILTGDSPRLLRLRETGAITGLIKLLDEVPLYQVNVELALDEALANRHGNAVLRRALEKAFGGDVLPNTLHGEDRKHGELASGGGLRHPMLGYLDRDRLCALYLNFTAALGGEAAGYEFGAAIIGAHEKPFVGYYDGWLDGGDGAIRCDILVRDGMRRDHDPEKKLETYTQGGRLKALQMAVTEPREILWAWLEADNYQMRRCRDIERLKRLTIGKEGRRWIRTDIFSLLEREAMKQIFAGSIHANDKLFDIARGAPAVQKALKANAAGDVDDLLQQLLAQTLNPDSVWSGAAGKFAEAAQARAQEARAKKLV
jgi:hypothetical protein